jgi:hypothetical protein
MMRGIYPRAESISNLPEMTAFLTETASYIDSEVSSSRTKYPWVGRFRTQSAAIPG